MTATGNCIRTIALGAVALLAATASCAAAASDNVVVTAANSGVFTFDIAASSFAFGTVDANGTTSSTGVTGARNGGNNGATYSASAATTWTSTSSPARTVRLFNASTTSTINWGTADRLGVRVPTTGLPAGSTSCGFKAFSTVNDGGAGSCASGNLVHSVAVGNGGSSVAGNLDLQLDVMDTDAVGSNSWTVLVTANGA